MFCAVPKPYLLILANLQSNKRQKKESLWFSNQHFAYMHISKREISIPTKVFLMSSISWSIILYNEL